MVLGIWDYIENKIEVSSLLVLFSRQPQQEHEELLWMALLLTWCNTVSFEGDKYSHSSHYVLSIAE